MRASAIEYPASLGQCRRWVAAFLFPYMLTVGMLVAIRSASGAESQPTADAQNPLKNLTLAQLGNVEVTTASRAPEQVWKTSAAIFVLTNDDIRRSGATTIPEALRLVPGVEVARINSNRWAIGIRGFGSRLTRDVLVLIDGRTVYTTLLAGTYWETQNLMLADVERIEVIRGPGATIWGPNAVNGVINIITRSTKDTHGEYVSVAGGNVDEAMINARYGGGNGAGLDYRVYGMAFDRGPEYHPGGIDYDRWRSVQGGFRMDIAKNDRDRFTIQGDAYDEGGGESVTAVTYAPPYSQVLDGTAPLSGGNILARWQRIQGEGKDFQLQMYYDRANRHELNFEDLRDTFDVDFMDRFRLPGQQISWGFGGRWSHGKNPTIVSGLYFIPESRTDQLYTAFFDDDISLVDDKLSVEIGTKLLKTNYTGAQWQPSIRLLWTPDKTQTFWAAFTHAVRTPSDAERAFYLSGFTGSFINGLPFFARFNANPNFHSEELNGYEFGYRQLLRKNVFVDVSAFYNHYGDLFSEDLVGAPYVEDNPGPPHYLLPAEFGNGLVGTTRGVEIAPEWKPLPSWRLRASYSFLQMELMKGTNSKDIGTAPITAGSSPRHEATAESGFDFTKSFSLDLTYRYVSHLPAQMIRGYSTADAQFTWHTRSPLSFSVVGRNLLQPYHYEFASDPAPNVAIKRSVYGQITWQQ
ncbi:MAG TPA: TonB-dependent receptor [Candidatus Sulfotelmatobacter sp.]|nr:TonB-dependent receptor [Candidatus Sulfotelmatobacter sp.]